MTPNSLHPHNNDGRSSSAPSAGTAPRSEPYKLPFHSTATDLIVDLSGLSLTDETVFQALQDAALDAVPSGGRIILIHPSEGVLNRIIDAELEAHFALKLQSLRAWNEPHHEPSRAIRRGFPILVPSMLAATYLIRDLALQMAQEVGFEETDLADIELCVGEATVNAVRHGSPRGRDDRFIVRFFQETDGLIIEIHDDGGGFRSDHVPEPHPEDLKENGLGIYLMRTLMDRVEFETNGGTRVTMEKRLSP
jgi:serine/threonine-protein kinase RsbW